MDGSRRLIVGAHTRADVINAARGWIGTPYAHQMSAKGSGCDCLGLVRGVWRELYGVEPETVPPYTPDWAEARGAELMRDAARRHLLEVAPDLAHPGDVLLFRIASTAPAKHAAILAPGERLIHAYWGRAVTTTAFAPWWRRRAAFAFKFPGVTD